ncbi:MAG: hypothetical protein HC802_04780 [Caldilineaceae bacterium]|nr:hypothetical protein [Caldilineaceae bacterium]
MHTHRLLWPVLLLWIAGILLLGACAPIGSDSTGESLVGSASGTSLQVRTSGSGGKSLLGGALALRARMAQSVEVIYSVVSPPDETTTSSRQVLIVRYSQEPVTTRDR